MLVKILGNPTGVPAIFAAINQKSRNRKFSDPKGADFGTISDAACEAGLLPCESDE